MTPRPGITAFALACLALAASARASAYTFAPAAAGAATEALQAFLDRPEDTLILPANRGGYPTGPLHVRRGRLTLILSPGVELRAAPAAFPRDKDCLLSMKRVEDVSLVGYGARLVMRRSEYLTGEWRHGINIRGCKRIRIEGLRIDSSGGDGIYVGSLLSDGLPASERISVRNCRLSGHRRQGISVVSARGLRLWRVRVDGTSGTAPECGIDFEPNDPAEILSDCVVRECEFTGNANHAALIFLGHFNASSEPVSILFDRCRLTGSRRGAGMQLAGFRSSGIRGAVRLRHCYLADNRAQAMVVLDKPERGMVLALDSCVLRQAGGSRAPGDRTPRAVFAMGRDEAEWEMGGVIARGLEIGTGAGVPLFREWADKGTRFASIRIEAAMTGLDGSDSGGPGALPPGVAWSAARKNPASRLFPESVALPEKADAGPETAW